MSKVKDIKNAPNPGRTIAGLRDTGYSFETAVADLIDNSIAAGAKHIDIQVLMDLHGKVKLFITDDGCGMDEGGLVQAMQYGSPQRSDPASLGKYGLGLKTASTAFCRCLSVISRPSSNAQALMATWDLDYVIAKGEWLQKMSDEPDEEALGYLNELAADNSGTVVLWTKVDRFLKDYQQPGGGPARTALRKRCELLGNHIAMTYQRFLDRRDKRANDIHIKLNGENIRPWDPFQENLSELVAGDIVSVQGNDVDAEFEVRAFILPRREDFPSDDLAKKANLSSERQGIYIYREQRLIHDADWLGMFQKEPHGTLLRVEFSFDHRLDDAFQLDIKKSRLILKDDLWKHLKDQFLPAPRREADRRYRDGQNKNIADRAKGTHDASNRAIGNKEAEVGGAEVNIDNPDTGDVTVTNSKGQFSRRLKIASASKPGEVFVQPTEKIELLFEPAMIEMHKAVQINTRHPYYHKVYVPNRNRSVTVQGLDSLLWALCVAELSATTNRTADSFQDMRFEVTRILRKLVEDLPDPENEEGDD